jgi:uncharacterized protein YijF (DUF1287 family)
MILPSCADLAADPAPSPGRPTVAPAPPRPPAEQRLGVADRGIWPDLDAQVQLELPQVEAKRVAGRVDRDHGVLVVSIDGFPRKVYPLTGSGMLDIGDRKPDGRRARSTPGGSAEHDRALALRPGDREELRTVLAPERVTEGPSAHDRDGDGIPDALDVFVGAKKELLNHEAYTQGALDYIGMRYPMGDVPRDIGVCTDVVIRAVRNAGHDLQQQLHDDIRRARSAYPMVKGTGDTSIDQRRVGTLLPYFKRHWETHSVKLGDPDDPWLPGDVIFMDTYPDRAGPDHVGIVSDRLDDDGLPLIINNWSIGLVVSEMDLLTFVPVLYRFRLPP